MSPHGPVGKAGCRRDDGAAAVHGAPTLSKPVPGASNTSLMYSVMAPGGLHPGGWRPQHFLAVPRGLMPSSGGRCAALTAGNRP